MRIDTEALKSNVDLRYLASRYTTLRGHERQKEWYGPCPRCGGKDRFHVTKTGFFCSHCHGERSLKHDAIKFFQWLFGLDFRAACERLAGGNLPTLPGDSRPTPHPAPITPVKAPADQWRDAARAFAERAEWLLWQPEGERGLDHLRSRGLADATIRAAHLGYNPKDCRPSRESWGLPPDPKKPKLWLPGPGIVIPWPIGCDIWRINIRLLKTRTIGDEEYRYIGPAGWDGANPLYNADALSTNHPAIMCEGELDALTIQQHAGDIITPVATGSTSGSRSDKWIARLTACSTVLVAFDADKAGDEAAKWWIKTLPNARRWRPFWKDANAMAVSGADIRVWVGVGLPESRFDPTPPGPMKVRPECNEKLEVELPLEAKLAMLKSQFTGESPVEDSPSSPATFVRQSVEDFLGYLEREGLRVAGPYEWRPDPLNPERLHPFVRVIEK